MGTKNENQKKKRKKGEINLKNWLVAKLRRISYQFPPRKEAIKKARVSRGKYRCASCGGDSFGPKQIQLDHIIPVVDPHTGFTTWDDFIERLFCDVDGWQILCSVCHEAKTFQENAVRRQVKSLQEPKDEEDDI